MTKVMSRATMGRHFQRIQYDVDASLIIDDRVFETKLIDLSLKGALLEVTTDETIAVGDRGELDFSLGDEAHKLSMSVEVAHTEATTLGVHCLQIDLDSVTHLRRILELYTGDSHIMEREIGAMLAQQN